MGKIPTTGTTPRTTTPMALEATHLTMELEAAALVALTRGGATLGVEESLLPRGGGAGHLLRVAVAVPVSATVSVLPLLDMPSRPLSLRALGFGTCPRKAYTRIQGRRAMLLSPRC